MNKGWLQRTAEGTCEAEWLGNQTTDEIHCIWTELLSTGKNNPSFLYKMKSYEMIMITEKELRD